MKCDSIRRSRRRAGLVALVSALVVTQTRATTNPSGGMILRVRLGDGSMERIQVASGSEESTTLSDILAPFDQDPKSTIQTGSTTIEDESQSLSSLGLKHGTLITITPPRTCSTERTSRFSTTTKPDRFDPFPDLARDYQTAVRRKATRRRSGMSYGDLADVQSALHVVEPQQEGPLKRVYMCRISAERFQSNCIVKHKKGGSTDVTCRAGLLLGTIQRERVDMKPVKARTSLSSTPSDQDYCQVAKVQALWEPPQSASTKAYDAKALITSTDDASLTRALTIASWLGLTPVGWIFSYTDSRSQEEDSLPVWGPDVWNGARLQIDNMQRTDRQEGAKFVTLAMDANVGATEAFQLSDVSVQMVAEDMWDASDQKGRFVKTEIPIFVDGKETTQLDSVLCLVNTAMLSHEGAYAGKTVNSVKKNGTLTTKTRKRLLEALRKDSTDSGSLLNALSDFNILMALDKLLAPKDTEELCRLVRKWVRGQKRGTHVSDRLKVALEGVLTS